MLHYRLMVCRRGGFIVLMLAVSWVDRTLCIHDVDLCIDADERVQFEERTKCLHMDHVYICSDRTQSLTAFF